jgi:integrase
MPQTDSIPVPLDRQVTLTGEATPARPLKGDEVSRRRFQSPKPERIGGWWYLRYWRDEFADGRITRRRIRHKLAPAVTREREVSKLAAEFLRPLNQGLTPVSSAITFNDYVTTAYNVDFLPLLAKSSRDRYEGIIRNYLVPVFGAKTLRDLTLQALQSYFTGLKTSVLSYESQDKIRDVMSAILTTAVKYGHLTKNPAADVRLAVKKTNRAKPYVEPRKFAAFVELIPEPYSTMVYVAIHSGMRAAELIGLRWKNVLADSILVEEKYCRGEWGPPKSEASNAAIAVPGHVIRRIHRLKTITLEIKAGNAVRRYPAVKSCEPEALVFQSPITGGPMRDNNILSRFVKPAGRKIGMSFVNWQVLRRSYATWLKMAGADVKDAQAQMRHSRVTTTLEVYQQFIPESQRRAVDKLSELIH